MIRKINIKNFKGLIDLTSPNISRITLFGGKNNVGKTTLLEALFMYFDRLNANMTIRQLNWRGINEIALTPENIFYPIFSKFDISNTIEISITNDQSITELMSINLKNEFRKSIVKGNINNNNIVEINTNQESLPTLILEISYKKTNESEQKVDLSLNRDGLGINTQNGRLLDSKASFLSAKLHANPVENAIQYSALDLGGKSESVIEFLKIIEPRLRSLSVIASPTGSSMIYGDIGIGKKVPISYMGDGMYRLLSIILSIASNENGVIFIDEIENGIHYSVMSKIWEALGEASQSFNCQIIATTHSYECLQSATSGLSKYKNDFSYIRLEKMKDNNRISAKYYDYEVLNSALEKGWEVR